MKTDRPDHSTRSLRSYAAHAHLPTPPLSLSSSPGKPHQPFTVAQTASELVKSKSDTASNEASGVIGLAATAASSLRNGLSSLVPPPARGVKIWSGPSADRPEACSSIMPSISESPLEKDFTVEGKPSKLGCPFASMAGKKLSSHAASVLSRYRQDSADGSREAAISSDTSGNHINGKASLARRSSRRTSFADPIKAEICGLSDHLQEDRESPFSERAFKEQQAQQDSAEVGVCPIRFLDQHSPEEVATYFERHKHELPRSHEICVRRYQSNEKQIRELDAKYGNLVSMIQGLGAKHQGLLPHEPDDGEADGDMAAEEDERKGREKVRKWASSVSLPAPRAEENVVAEENDQGNAEREQHFERPLRDIRVGESPTRPWGISVPAKYVEEAERKDSNPTFEANPSAAAASPDARHQKRDERSGDKACPFGFDRPKAPPAKKGEAKPQQPANARPSSVPAGPKAGPGAKEIKDTSFAPGKASHMTFNGPVFFGYGADDAIKIMQHSHFRTRSP